MVRAALYGVTGMVICMPGNLVVSRKLSAFLEEIAGAGNATVRVISNCNVLALDAATLLSLIEENRFETFDELTELISQKVSLSPEKKNLHLQIISDLTEFIAVQREILSGGSAEIRIPARSSAEGGLDRRPCTNFT